MLDPEYFIEIFKVLPSPSLLLKFNSHIFMIAAANDAFLLDSHLNLVELLDHSFVDVFHVHHPDGVEGWQALLNEVIQEKKPIHFAMATISTAKGSVFKRTLKPDDLIFTPVLNQQQEVECIICTAKLQVDLPYHVHPQPLITENLFTPGKFLEETQRMAKVGTWEVNLSNNVIIWSDVQKEIHDADLDFNPDWEFISRLYSLPPQEELMAFINKVASADGKLFDMELDFTSLKGNRKWVRIIGKVEVEAISNRCVRLYGILIDITDHSQTSFNLIAANHHIQSLLKTLGIVVWEKDLQTNKMNFISGHVKKISGYAAEDWVTNVGFKEDHLHPKDKNRVTRLMAREMQKGKNFSFDYRIAKAGNKIAWFQDIISVVMENEQPVLMRGLTVDITTNKRLYELALLEKQVLELNGKRGSTVSEVLNAYVEGMEAIFDLVKCSVLEVKDNRLYKWAAPSLPHAYLEAIEGLSVLKSVGTSGIAALLKHHVIYKDIKNDNLWRKNVDILLSAKIKSCWAYPIMNADNVVMATLGIYHQEAKGPSENEAKVIDRAIGFLTLILENRHILNVLQETNLLMIQCQEMAGFGIWSWDLCTNNVCWSDALYSIYGLTRAHYKPTFESYLDMLHAEDKERVSANFGGLLSTKQKVEFEARIRRPNQEVRHLKSFAKLILDENGVAIKMIGAHFDITTNRIIQEKLRLSESHLKNLVQAQTNYVIRINFKGTFTYANDRFLDDFKWMYEGEGFNGRELFKVIYGPFYNKLFDLAERCMNYPHLVSEIELEMPNQKGGLKVILWHLVCLNDDHGSPSEMQCTGVDVTKHQFVKNNTLVDPDGESYLNLVDNTATCDWNLVNNEVNWGQGFQNLFGYAWPDRTSSVILWASKVHPEDWDRVRADLKTALKNEHQFNFIVNYRFQKADGYYVNIQGNAYILRNAAGEGIRIIAALTEIKTVS